VWLVTLFPYRVLDLTDEKGFLCGKLLADLGAEVIKVERPGGEPSRNIQPFYQDIPHPEKSLNWFAFNLNKKGITLDIETADGKAIFQKLVQRSDFIIESFPVGHLDSLGLGYSVLSELKPSIILTSITPFGQRGPYKGYKGSDLTLLAMGGFLYITGYPDRPPMRISFPQSWLLAGSNAAASTMIAHHYRQNTGIGQHVDVSVQANITWTITNVVTLWELTSANLARKGSVLTSRYGTGANQRILWRCKDGFVAYIVFGGRLGVNMGNTRLTGWMQQEGIADHFLTQFDWENHDLALATQETQSRLEAYVERLFIKYTKLELYQEGRKRDIKIFPAYSPGDMVDDPQLQSRGLWVNIEHPELKDSINYPGFFFKTSASDPPNPFRAPLIGEHNREIYRQLGLSGSDLVRLKQAGII
jgi:crotonobetainyl-CoA:carnitine CoA-transferase CaiB-like acyl-CoA transferase